MNSRKSSPPFLVQLLYLIISSVGAFIAIYQFVDIQINEFPEYLELSLIHTSSVNSVVEKTTYKRSGTRSNLYFKTDKGDNLRYFGWFPKYNFVKNSLIEKHDINFWVDAREIPFDIYQIEIEGKMIVSHDEMVKSRQFNSNIGLGLGIIFTFLSVYIFIKIRKEYFL